MGRNTRYTLLTLVKGLAALEALEAVDGGLTLTELARRLKESQTVVFRVLKTLEEHGYVRHDSVSRRYTLGLRIWELGARVAGRTGLVEAARPVLKWLTTVTGQTSGLVVLRGTDVLYLDIRDGQEALRFYVEPGARAPAYGTASGKVMLAWHPERVPQVVKAGLRRLTPTTIVGAADLRRELQEIRRAGVAINRGERQPDLAAVAAPIFDAHGECVAAVGIAGSRTRFTDDLEDFKRHVRKASDEISAKLGHRA
jgi:IclR family transcriptional regulator, KDG regulon repressor